ncbi:MAG: helix-turn-helix transcriptional regulator [Spirochaetaceae bacterium]|jgi:predicted transcriptional regulator YheO|nr:helix-turn-helix transcriptional regulator [Spirochaetaceae bacterium]
MHNINDEMNNLKRLVQMLAAQFGGNTEVVLHDLSKDYRHTIVAIENNQVTGRKVGDGGTNLGLEVLRNPPNTNGDIYNYFNKTTDGRMLRSSTLYFRNGEGRVIGSLCINTDITRMVEMRETLGEIAMIPPDRSVEEVFANNVEELFEYFIRQSRAIVDKPAAEMTKEDRIEVIRFLDSKGFFLITRAGDEACKFLAISKYTLYKYLAIARGKSVSDTIPPEEVP